MVGEVWRRFGQVENYAEPFFGSGAVLLGCPHTGHTETVNDADGLLVNFWRAVQADPGAVAHHADYPVSEIDLHARHTWLVARRADVDRLLADPEWYDAKAAGWWVWGLSQWIGTGWCHPAKKPSRQLPMLHGDSGASGRGVHRKSLRYGQLPDIGGNSRGGRRGRPVISIERDGALYDYLRRLADRLRHVRIVCGDFARVLSPSVTWRHGVTAVFLDPPYYADRSTVYAVDGFDAAIRARDWAAANGDNPLLRIALCEYAGDHDMMPAGWTRYDWKAPGGYGNQGNGRGRENATRECIWFSPHCISETPMEALIRRAAAPGESATTPDE